ncbi:Rcs stress response system protein RcsF [Colwellia psychrerythraea]|uniref:RcsF protein n=1 Tax=Colwellia psychrerythraea TaxID=28229 RepID=A0A099KRL7_COLPS|nr:Rcs stress response system protein RcsF [Colwellia psychrerythraea]KGJ92870.1 hypothetical protein GAB14E_2786 [Colwellia psychrerythraea]
MTQKLTKEIIALCLASPLLASCSGNYSFESNVTPDDAQQYFSASKVKIFNDETEFMSSFDYVGLVEGEDCQKKEHLAPPDVINARTQARQVAFKQQANAVIFTSCVDIETKHCVAQVVCYGKAYRLGPPHEPIEQ